MKTQLLKDESVYPSTEILESLMGSYYPAFERLSKEVVNESLGLNMEWRYYKDGKAWLCKVTFKKKTVFWLSVWQVGFTVTFYFTEKTGAGVVDLPIGDAMKEEFYAQKPIGRLIPLTFSINRTEQIEEVLAVVKYKKSLK